MLTIIFGILIWLLIVAIELGLISFIEKKMKKRIDRSGSNGCYNTNAFSFSIVISDSSGVVPSCLMTV